MKVLVLGGTGFVGSHIARELLAAGHEVAVAVRPTSPRDMLAGAAIEYVPADVEDPASLEAACAGRDAVIHTVGILSLWERDKDLLYRVNVLGTRNVVEACLRTGVKRMVYTGSVGIYSGTERPLPVDEGGARTAERFHSFHVTSMCLAEAEVWKGLARGLDAVLLHPSLCFGPGDRSLHSSWVLVVLATTRLALSPPGGLNAVDVRDVARAHVLAAERGPRGGNYLVGGENLTNRALIEVLQEVLGNPASANLPLPRAGMHALGSALELFARARGQDRGAYLTMNRSMSRAMGLYWFLDDSRARRELGYGSGPVRPAIERQVAWLREQGLLPETGFGALEFFQRFLRAPRGA